MALIWYTANFSSINFPGRKRAQCNRKLNVTTSETEERQYLQKKTISSNHIARCRRKFANEGPTVDIDRCRFPPFLCFNLLLRVYPK